MLGRASILSCVLLFVGPLLLGCVGQLGGEAGDETGTDGANACAGGPGRVGLHRLTRAEYNRTVRELFGVTSNPADAFPPDSTTGGFDNNAASLTTSPQLAALLLDISETVAVEALQTRRDEILSCDPTSMDRAECARQILSEQALRVYRRPPSEEEIDGLMTLVDVADAEGESFEVGIQTALQGMLMAPQFLYRGVPADGEPPDATTALDDFALATRLSYFLWGSTPDDLLLQRAGEGALQEETLLRAEFDRLLADPKSSALYEDFFRAWLKLGKLESATPDVAAFPEFDESMRAAMLEETRLFFEDIRQRDASPLELLTGSQTFANDQTADIYGASEVSGSELVSIDVDSAQRAGILTMPAILTMTSGPEYPNIVQRGVWLAEAILCASPPPPAQGVPVSPDPVPGETERQRLERHRQDPECAGCHNLIDPLGFGFENYDAIGRWRTTAEGEPVDNLGRLPDGREYSGIPELVELLEAGQEFPQCVTEKAMTYALGRTLDSDDVCATRAIALENVTPESQFSGLLWAIVTSEAFRKQEAGL